MSIDKKFYCSSKKMYKNLIEELRNEIIDLTCSWNIRNENGTKERFYCYIVDGKEQRIKYENNQFYGFTYKQLVQVLFDFDKEFIPDLKFPNIDLKKFDEKYNIKYRVYNPFYESYLYGFRRWCSQELIHWCNGYWNKHIEYWDSNRKSFQCRYCDAQATKIKKISHKKDCANKLEIMLNIPLNETNFWKTKEQIYKPHHPFKNKSVTQCAKKINKYFEKYSKIFGEDKE